MDDPHHHFVATYCLYGDKLRSYPTRRFNFTDKSHPILGDRPRKLSTIQTSNAKSFLFKNSSQIFERFKSLSFIYRKIAPTGCRGGIRTHDERLMKTLSYRCSTLRYLNKTVKHNAKNRPTQAIVLAIFFLFILTVLRVFLTGSSFE